MRAWVLKFPLWKFSRYNPLPNVFGYPMATHAACKTKLLREHLPLHVRRLVFFNLVLSQFTCYLLLSCLRFRSRDTILPATCDHLKSTQTIVILQSKTTSHTNPTPDQSHRSFVVLFTCYRWPTRLHSMYPSRVPPLASLSRLWLFAARYWVQAWACAI